MRSKHFRKSRVAMYACFVGAGFSVPFLGLPIFEDVVNTSIILIGFGLFVGGLICMVGHIIHHLMIERAGYPILIASFGGLTLILLATDDQRPARTFVGFIMLGLMFGLYGRDRDLKTLVKFTRADQVADDGRRQDADD